MKKTFESIQLGTIEIFIKAAETGSFTKAASELGIGAPAVSRSIARLEKRLGTQLFSRSTRTIRLTDDGQTYFNESRDALRQLLNAENAISGKQQEPSGQLRISVPTTYGHYRIMPLIAEFLERYPNVEMEVNISNQNIDFIQQGYDLAIRLGTPQDSRLVARKIEDAALGVYAAPEILKRTGKPETPQDLERMPLVLFDMPSTGKPLPWIFEYEGKKLEFSFSSRIHVSEDVLGCINHAVHGGGYVQTYDFIVREHLESGKLVEVLHNHRGRSRPFSMLYPQSRHLSSRVRAFTNFVLEKCKLQR